MQKFILGFIALAAIFIVALPQKSQALCFSAQVNYFGNKDFVNNAIDQEVIDKTDYILLGTITGFDTNTNELIIQSDRTLKGAVETLQQPDKTIRAFYSDPCYPPPAQGDYVVFLNNNEEVQGVRADAFIAVNSSDDIPVNFRSWPVRLWDAQKVVLGTEGSFLVIATEVLVLAVVVILIYLVIRRYNRKRKARSEQ